MSWVYRNKPLTKAPDSNKYIGFIYEMTYLPTGQKYIGRKRFWEFKKTKIGVREKARTKTRKKHKWVVKESNWKNYKSSSEILKNVPINQLERKILKLCRTKKEMSYYEEKYQFSKGVLESDKWLNGNIRGVYFRKDLENSK